MTETTELTPQLCPHCDFGSGHRGSDRCSVCDGMGSVFIVKGTCYENTECGHHSALEALNDKAT